MPIFHERAVSEFNVTIKDAPLGKLPGDIKLGPEIDLKVCPFSPGQRSQGNEKRGWKQSSNETRGKTWVILISQGPHRFFNSNLSSLGQVEEDPRTPIPL